MLKSVMKAANTQPRLTDIKYPVLASPKIDGVRACVQGGKLVSRSLKDSLNRYVTGLLSKPVFEGLDGELTVQCEALQNDFNVNQSAIMTQSGKPKVVFWVFDNMAEGHLPASTRKANLIDRVKLIQMSGFELEVRLCPQITCNRQEDVEELYDKYRALGFEGLILMDPMAQYKHGRSTLKQGIMLKLKPCEDAEATIIGMEELMHNMDAGNTKRAENLVPGNMMGKLRVQMGMKTFCIGTGFTTEQRIEMWNNMNNYLGKLCTFKYMELSKYGIPRSPVYKGIRSTNDV